MKLVLEWSMAKRKDGWQALLQQISDKYRSTGFDSRFYRATSAQKEDMRTMKSGRKWWTTGKTPSN